MVTEVRPGAFPSAMYAEAVMMAAKVWAIVIGRRGGGRERCDSKRAGGDETKSEFAKHCSLHPRTLQRPALRAVRSIVFGSFATATQCGGT